MAHEPHFIPKLRHALYWCVIGYHVVSLGDTIVNIFILTGKARGYTI
jgi:hypothetical protein